MFDYIVQLTFFTIYLLGGTKGGPNYISVFSFRHELGVLPWRTWRAWRGKRQAAVM